MNKYFLSLLTILFISTPNVMAEQVAIDANVSTTVAGLGESITLQVTVSGDIQNLPNPEIPQIPNFNIVSSGSSQNFTYTNGKLSASSNYTLVLVPGTKGKFTIPPIKTTYKNKVYETKPIEVEVTDPRPKQNIQAAKTDGSYKAEYPVIARVSKKNLYVNEQFTYSFIYDARLARFPDARYTLPDFTGFWPEVPKARNEKVTVNSKSIPAGIHDIYLFASKPGVHTFNPSNISFVIDDSGFGNFLLFSTGKRKTLETESITINTKPLPEKGKPAIFNGAVGKYTIAAKLDKYKTKVNEPVTLITTINGSGNIKIIPEPVIDEWPGFKKYETVSSNDVQYKNSKVSGWKKFSTVIIPETQGTKTIPKIQFAYFDPDLKKYVTIYSKELKLEVKPSDTNGAAIYNSGDITVKVINKDVRYIKLVSKIGIDETPFYKGAIFKVINLLSVLIILLSLIYSKWSDKLKSDTAFRRRLTAPKFARKYLLQARDMLENNDSSGFYTCVSRSIFSYIADKENISAESLTFKDIESILNKHSINNETISKIRELTEECDMARFAPNPDKFEVSKNSFERAVKILKILEKHMK